jgi:septal ring factor EnvC (AmiA/AmiB activator)
MKLMTKTALVALPLALAAATMTLADSGDTKGDRGQRYIERLQSKLGLSDDQTNTIQSALAADRDSRRQIQSQLGEAMRDLRKSALNGDDGATLQTKRTAAQQIFGQLLDLRAKELGKIGAVLNQDQRQAYAEMTYEGSQGRHGSRGKHHPSTSATPSDG